MSRKCCLLSFQIMLILCLVSDKLYTREEGKIIIISERVGETIDKDERDSFKQFQDIDVFQSATYFRLHDNRIFLEVTYQDKQTGELITSRVQKSEANIKNTKKYIDNFEEIDARKTEQEKTQIFIISNIVGEEIDIEERDKYKLFQDINGFQSAAFIKLSNNRYIVKIISKDEQTGELEIDRIEQTEESINNIRNIIENKCRDISKKWLCISPGWGLPLIENCPQKFNELGYAFVMISSPRIPIALLLAGGFNSREQSTENLYQEVSFETYSILWMIPITKSKKTNAVIGGGIGSYNIYYGEGGITSSPTVDLNERLYALEIGCKTRIPILGFYAKYKWFYSKSLKNCTKLIIGFDLNLCL